MFCYFRPPARFCGAPTFLVGTALLLVINFASLEDQSDVLRRHAPTALSMAGVILAAAMFLGILDGTGMLEQIALSIVQQTAEAFGVSGMGAASAMIVGNVIGTFVSPFSPALWLALGLARGEMGKYIRLAFPVCWAFSIALVLGAWAFGIFA